MSSEKDTSVKSHIGRGGFRLVSGVKAALASKLYVDEDVRRNATVSDGGCDGGKGPLSDESK